MEITRNPKKCRVIRIGRHIVAETTTPARIHYIAIEMIWEDLFLKKYCSQPLSIRSKWISIYQEYVIWDYYQTIMRISELYKELKLIIFEFLKLKFIFHHEID